MVVAGHGREQVGAEAVRYKPDAAVVVQDRQAGTGHAVRMVIEALGVMPGVVLVTYGDMPLLRGQTLAALVREHAAAGNAVTVLTARPGPADFGRIVRDGRGALVEIVEYADATPEQRAIDEVNSGCYAFDGALLADAIKRVATDNAQGQEYLTDVVAILRGDGHPVGAILAADPGEIQGVNDRVQLAQVRRAYNSRLLEGWMRAGVTIVDPAATWIDVDVTIGQDTEIGPYTQLEGAHRDRRGRDDRTGLPAPGHHGRGPCRGGPRGLPCGPRSGPDATVGPYAYLRPGTRIGAGAHIGCHVELKNSVVGAGAKVPHLSYVGDADIGERANIGAATIFSNYDGVAKHHTTVGADVFTGSDTILVAPVTIGEGAYTAAGSVITEDVPAGALGVARGRQHNSEGWVERRRPGTPAAAQARRAAESASAEPPPRGPAGDHEDEKGR